MSRAAHNAAAHNATGGSTQQRRAAGQALLPVSEGQQHQELPRQQGFAAFLGRWRKTPAAAGGAEAAAAAASEAASGSSRPSWAGGIELQGASSSPKAQFQPTDSRLQPAVSAYAAALAPRTSFSTDGPAGAAAGSFGRPPPVLLPPGRAARSLASRSAAPALVYGGSAWSSTGAGPSGGAAGSGFEGPNGAAPTLVSPQPGHRRRGSDSLSVTHEQQEHDPVQQQMSLRALSSVPAAGAATAGAAAAAAKKGSWGLAGSWTGLQDLDSAAPADGSPRVTAAAAAGGGGRVPGLTGTEKALGRRSGMYGRSLGTRSTNLADRWVSFGDVVCERDVGQACGRTCNWYQQHAHASDVQAHMPQVSATYTCVRRAGAVGRPRNRRTDCSRVVQHLSFKCGLSLLRRYGGGSESFTPFQPFHLPEAEAAEGSPLARHSRSFASTQLDTQVHTAVRPACRPSAVVESAAGWFTP